MSKLVSCGARSVGNMAKKQRKRGAHPLPAISEEMKAWAAALGGELETWPKVTSKPMFGMTAYYLGEKIFAVLPKHRGFVSEKSIGIRIDGMDEPEAEELKKDKRVTRNPIGSKWMSFEIDGPRDLNSALDYLAQGYELCRKAKKPKAEPKKSSKTAARKKSTT